MRLLHLVGIPYRIEINSKPDGEHSTHYDVTWKTPHTGGLPIVRYEFKVAEVSLLLLLLVTFWIRELRDVKCRIAFRPVLSFFQPCCLVRRQMPPLESDAKIRAHCTIDGQTYVWPFSVFTPKRAFGPRTAKSQPIWIKFCTHLYCWTEYTCGPT